MHRPYPPILISFRGALTDEGITRIPGQVRTEEYPDFVEKLPALFDVMHRSKRPPVSHQAWKELTLKRPERNVTTVFELGAHFGNLERLGWDSVFEIMEDIVFEPERTKLLKAIGDITSNALNSMRVQMSSYEGGPASPGPECYPCAEGYPGEVILE